MTFALQAVLSHTDGFRDWYEARRIELERDPLSSYFVERRNEALKTGETRINAGSVTRGRDGRLVVRHVFSSSHDEPEPIDLDVVTACRTYASGLRDLIAAAKAAFPIQADPDWYFDLRHLAAAGLEIEDLEEMCGLPRGWTGGIPAEARLAALRDLEPIQRARHGFMPQPHH